MMRQSRLFAISALIAAALLSLYVTPSQAVSAKDVTNISDTDIALPIIHSGETPKYKRVVALADGSAEIIAALGYKNILVGRDIASTMPALAQVPIDESAMQVSSESVLSQSPDLIFIDSNTSPATALATFKQSHIPMITISDSYSLGAIVSKEMAIASALGVPKAGALLASQVQALHYPNTGIKVAFLYLRGTASIYLIGGAGSGADSLLKATGFIDVGAAQLKLPFNALTSEELIKLQPDVLLLMTKGLVSVGGINGLVQIPGIAQTPAGRNHAVVTVDDSLLLSFGPRSVPMARALRPLLIAAAKKSA